ncbi:MAG: MarC family protein [Proteobacteria bacterium]|nr:MarC family protein [Pseudomonadota bacterium]
MTFGDPLIRPLINDFITLFVAIDPIGTVPILIPLLSKYSAAERKKIILKAAFIATAVLAGFALFGHVLLASMGISFAAFRIAGGIVLFIVGAKLIFEEPNSNLKPVVSEQGHDPAVFPLAMPYLAGPATTLAVMVATQQEQFDPVKLSAKIFILVLVLAVSVLILLSSTRIHKWLGRTGSEVIGRVMGILLAALAAESVVRGIGEAFNIH